VRASGNHPIIGIVRLGTFDGAIDRLVRTGEAGWLGSEWAFRVGAKVVASYVSYRGRYKGKKNPEAQTSCSHPITNMTLSNGTTTSLASFDLASFSHEMRVEIHSTYSCLKRGYTYTRDNGSP